MNEYLQKVVHPGQPGSKPMSIDSISDLTLKDIKFLTAVRDINANPEQYPGTEGGVAAANTTSLRQGTSLSKGEIRHRLDDKSDIADEDLGLLTIHDPPQTKQGYGPKSVELTSWGNRFLDDALAVHGLGDHDPTDVAQADRVSGLEARIEELEARIEELEETDLADRIESTFVFEDPGDTGE